MGLYSSNQQKKSYERLAVESEKAFEAFRTYCELGTARSMVKAAQLLGKSYQQMSRWSNNYNWQNRVEEWDMEQQRILQLRMVQERWETHERDLKEFRNHHLSIAKQAFKASVIATRKVTEYLEKKEKDSKFPKDTNEAVATVGIIKGLMPLSELWAKALGIDKLLVQLQEEEAEAKASDDDELNG